MAARNLWGELPDVGNIKPPVAILREQASVLGQMTNNVLQAAVDVKRRDPYFYIDFYIVAPALDSYAYSVLQVYHQVHMYPLTLHSYATDQHLECQNEQEFLDALANVLSSESVKKVILSLLAQSKATQLAINQTPTSNGT